MEMWGICLVLAAFGTTTIYSDSSLTYPELARNEARIVSGWEAEPGQFPYQLSIRMVTGVGGVVSCGASIIHSNWGLTAAHCTANRFTIIVRAGSVNLTRPGLIFETLDYWNHPLYNPNLNIVQPNDIGLIRFNRDIVFNLYIQPIRMQRSADKDRNYNDVRLTASGWGVTWTQGSSPENLNWVFLRGTSNELCRQTFGSTVIQDSTICAGGYNDTTQSTCSGDSGGPLTVIDQDGIITEVGVASFVSGSGCHANFPAGFIRPGHYHDWFYEVSGIDFDWDFDGKEDNSSGVSGSDELVK